MSIFISIASYEDKLLEQTIDSAIANADRPDELFFGLALSYSVQPMLNKISNRSEIIRFAPEDRPGVVKKRYLISKMFTDQDYFLQIDSHTYFLRGWDTRIIEQLNEVKSLFSSNKIILTSTIEKTDKTNKDYIVNNNKVRATFEIMPENSFAIDHQVYPITEGYSQFNEATIASSCMFFTDKYFIKDVGLDPYSQTYEEQSYLAFRAFMNGWTMYTPRQSYVVHSPFAYYRDLYAGDKSKRRFATNDTLQLEWKTDTLKDINAAMLYNLGKYSFPNSDKSPSDWWQYLGLNKEYDWLIEQNFLNII